jgi:hypothetical protein
MLVDQVVIDAEFGRKDNGSISHNCDQKELEPHDARTDPQTKLSSPVSQILVVKTKKKINKSSTNFNSTDINVNIGRTP